MADIIDPKTVIAAVDPTKVLKKSGMNARMKILGVAIAGVITGFGVFFGNKLGKKIDEKGINIPSFGNPFGKGGAN